MTTLHQPTTTATLPLAETFGPTLQGEGPAAGRAAWFIRTGGCNLSCHFCDSAYTWDGNRYTLAEEITPTGPAEVTRTIPDGTLVILTGGEPLLHQHNPAWGELLDRLASKDCPVHVETNGTRAATEHTVRNTNMQIVSPKLGNAGTHRGNQNPTMRTTWTQHAQAGTAHLKVVCQTAEDVATAVHLADTYHWPRHQVWVMPEGTDTATLTARWPTIADTAAQLGINATHRLHILAWGDERGH